VNKETVVQYLTALSYILVNLTWILFKLAGIFCVLKRLKINIEEANIPAQNTVLSKKTEAATFADLFFKWLRQIGKIFENHAWAAGAIKNMAKLT